MSGQDWSILISPPASGSGPCTFTPELNDQQVGAPLQTGGADIVSWNNRTSLQHQPWPLGSDGQKLSEADAKNQNLYLSDPIEPWSSSPFGFVTTAPAATNPPATPPPTTINYTCNFHADERGSIVVHPV